MGLFKIIGGVALGVGAIAAAPFTGGGSVLAAASLGASLAGATGAAAAAGAVGGVVGAAMSNSDKEEGRREGERVATAKYSLKEEKLKKQMEEIAESLKDTKEYFQLVIALSAVGMATANADGDISQKELDEFEEYVLGPASKGIPDTERSIIEGFKSDPPTLNQAMAYVKKLKDIEWELFETVIEVISASDGYTDDEEKAFLKAFRRLKVA